MSLVIIACGSTVHWFHGDPRGDRRVGFFPSPPLYPPPSAVHAQNTPNMSPRNIPTALFPSCKLLPKFAFNLISPIFLSFPAFPFRLTMVERDFTKTSPLPVLIYEIEYRSVHVYIDVHIICVDKSTKLFF